MQRRGTCASKAYCTMRNRRLIARAVALLCLASQYSHASVREIKLLRDPRNTEPSNRHQGFLNRLRRLWALSDVEVQQLIFERHTEDPPEKKATVSPAPFSSSTPSEPQVPVATTAFPTTSPLTTLGPTISPSDSGGVTFSPTLSGTAATGGPSTAEPDSFTESPGGMGTPEPTDIGETTLIPTVSGISATGGPLTASPDSSTDSPGGLGTLEPTILPTAGPGTSETIIPTVSDESPSIAPEESGSSPPVAEVSTIAPTILDGASNVPSSILPETVESFLNRTLTTDGSMQIEGTPQFKALQALTRSFPNLDPTNGTASKTEITQVYSLNTLFFSTNGTDWINRTGWGEQTLPCGTEQDAPWAGVTCETVGIGGIAEVAEINLSSNDMFGELPSEVRGLTSLGKTSLLELGSPKVTGARYLTRFLYFDQFRFKYPTMTCSEAYHSKSAS